MITSFGDLVVKELTFPSTSAMQLFISVIIMTQACLNITLSGFTFESGLKRELRIFAVIRCNG